MPRPAPIPALRRQIDRIDDQLLRLLNRRARLALAVGGPEAAPPSRRSTRPGASRACSRACRSRTAARSARRTCARSSARSSRRRAASRQRLRVAYLGPQATWTHLAAAAPVRRRGGVRRRRATVADVFHDVEGGRAELGVVPVENSTEGMVAHTLDLLVESPLAICAEVLLPIRHCLLARPGTTLATVRRVVAHPQALAQCRQLAGGAPPGRADRRGGEQRAGRRARAADERGHGGDRGRGRGGDATGSRCSRAASRTRPDNVTRFLVLGAPRQRGAERRRQDLARRERAATRSGCCARMLRPFATHRIDLIKIESRPLRGAALGVLLLPRPQGASPRAARGARAGGGRARARCGVKVLGSYPAAPPPERVMDRHPPPRAGVDPDADAVSAREADRGGRARARHPGLDQAGVEREPARAVAEGAGRGRGGARRRSTATRTARRSTCGAASPSGTACRRTRSSSATARTRSSSWWCAPSCARATRR